MEVGEWYTSCKPSQAKPSQAKPSQVCLNIILGLTALDSSKNAFPLRNQGKGVFCFYTHSLPIVYDTKTPNLNATKKKPWGRGVLQYAPTVAALIFLERWIMPPATFLCRAKSLFALQQARRGERKGCLTWPEHISFLEFIIVLITKTKCPVAPFELVFFYYLSENHSYRGGYWQNWCSIWAIICRRPVKGLQMNMIIK